MTSPDLECPECGWLDSVPVRDVERFALVKGVAVERRVGKVVRCAKCVCEYVVGPSGVYRPQIAKAQPPETSATPPPRRDEPLMLRDNDQPWDRKRRR
jgi:hypothetical protein